jgi:hypothetical protein
MKPTVAKSWDHALQLLFDGAYDRGLKRFRSPYAFRGMTQDWPLTPSLLRLGHPADLVPRIEKAMFRNFRKYAYSEVGRDVSEWEWLAIAQHHGLPTRLMDWTYSPFVGLHFATDQLQDADKDGIVYMVDFIASNDWLPAPLRQVLSDNFALGFDVAMLKSKFERIDELEELKGAEPEFILFFEPPSLDPRIVNQWGLFSLMNGPLVDLNRWLDRGMKARPKLAKKIVIPAKLKWEIRDKLDHMNLTERVIYPGLDGLSQWLKRWYSPKQAAKSRGRNGGARRGDAVRAG